LIIFHSEFNNEKSRETHLLQIWILPKVKEIAPRYDQKSFSGEFTLVVSGSGRDGSLQINQDAEIFVGKFSAQKTFDFVVKKDRKIWIQIVFGKISVNGEIFESGDAAAIENESELKITAEENSEFLLLDL
jgi:redox-sensitive bicupin YhaK (pirin superfamily)